MSRIVVRAVSVIVASHRQREGGGFIVRRPLPSGSLDSVGGLFLMLDELGPIQYAPGEAVGAPDHPHRGFCTLSYILEGEMQHKDSAGNAGLLSAGWMQYMRAGRGVVHAEMPSERVQKLGGTVWGFQIWLNLPAKDKMSAPKYQDIAPEGLPTVQLGGASGSSIKVLVGSWGGVTSVIEPDAEGLQILDVTLAPGGSVEIPVAAGHCCFVYAFQGSGTIGGGAGPSHLPDGSMAVMGDGDLVQLSSPSNATTPLRALVASGPPLHEPIARHGPFVMNTKAQLEQAFDDYRHGRMGEIAGAEERHAATEAARRAQKASGAWEAGNKK